MKIKIEKRQIIHVTVHLTQKLIFTSYMSDIAYYSLCASSILHKAWQFNCALVRGNSDSSHSFDHLSCCVKRESGCSVVVPYEKQALVHPADYILSLR